MNLQEMGPVAILFVFIAVVASVGSVILGTVQQGEVTGAAGCNSTATTGCGYAHNISVLGAEGIDELASWLPLIALVIAAAVVIGVLLFLRS